MVPLWCLICNFNSPIYKSIHLVILFFRFWYFHDKKLNEIKDKKYLRGTWTHDLLNNNKWILGKLHWLSMRICIWCTNFLVLGLIFGSLCYIGLPTPCHSFSNSLPREPHVILHLTIRGDFWRLVDMRNAIGFACKSHIAQVRSCWSEPKRSWIPK